MSSNATSDDELEGLETFEDSENLSVAGHGGIRAFHGSESSIFANSELNSEAANQKKTPTMQPQAELLLTSSALPEVDTLEFLEFISKNGIRIIPYEELELQGSHTRDTDAVLLQGANMKVIPGKWHTDERPYTHWSSLGSMAVALKVFKQAPVSAAFRDEGGLGSALDVVRAREAAGAYTRLMRDIFYEMQIMHQAGANQHKNVAQLYGISFEAGTGASSTSDGHDSGSTASENDEIFVQRYLRPILVSPLAHTEYPDLRHFLAHKGDSRPRPLTWGIACSLIGDIGEGLHALHHVNVVHADLKPENILIYPSDDFDKSSSTQNPEAIRIQARVADFGFSGFKNVQEMTPRGGTRVWNAPECLYGWEDVYAQLKDCGRGRAIPEEVLRVEAGEWSRKATRDIYSFGLIMVHILLDGVEPLPFRNLAELDRLKLADGAKEIAVNKVRSMHAERLSRGGGRDDGHGDGWDQETLERIVKLVDSALTVYPWARRQSLNAIRSYLAGKYIYDRDLDITRMVITNRFPALASTKFSDYFHQSAASIPAIQLSFSKLPSAIKQSVFQHYLTMGIDTLTNIQKMRLLGICTQEIRDSQSLVANERPIPSQESGHPIRSSSLAKPFLQMLTGVEGKLLDQYHTSRDRKSNIRKTLEHFATYDASEIADNKDAPQVAGQLGLTALHVAAMRGDVKGVKALLNGGATRGCKSRSGLGYITPLELAIAWCPEGRKAVDIVQALLPSAAGYEVGADNASLLGARVGCKTTMLHMAAARKTSAILRFLFSVEGVCSEVLDTRDAYFRTPLHIAAQVGSLACVELLLDRGANAQLRDYDCLTPYELAQKYSLGFTKDYMALCVRSDMIYDVLTYGQNVDWGSAADYEAVIQKFNTIATSTQSVAMAPEQLSDPLLFQLPSQLKDYKAPVDNTKPPAFTLTEDWDKMTDYFIGAASPVGSGDYLHKYSYRATATSIPRENEALWLPE
ncbi:kinase-like domain-containing protein [Tirmania nivea]|nr:kinase-like domain-containing protein [Tirmania nivea]